MDSRELLFRGQTRKRGEKVNMAGEPLAGIWVYGGIFQGKGDRSVIYTYDPVDKFPVYNETVGQCIGIPDRNGVKIFDGDIVRHYNRPDEPDRYSQGVVFWDNTRLEWRRTGQGDETWKMKPGCIYEVIGNIYDTPELMEG